MSRYHTNSTAIRKNRSEYYRLRAYEARLNEQLHHMLKRIKQIEENEKLSLANQKLLTYLLAQATLQKAELEAQPDSKERNKQLKKAEKEFKEVDARYKRNEYHLAVLEKKKDKDNAAKYILKENKRDQVSIRIQIAYDTWMQLEQAQQQINLKLSKEAQSITESVTDNTTLASALTSVLQSSSHNEELIKYWLIRAVAIQRVLLASRYTAFRKR
ncbi:hypothetical protein QNI19_12960 [Cytophagaceae bacterium DM2B3-1]|uniref:Uncharacterized protein n=1 Tax=Xanthocytophaga flava TaxID=3048013 RepID=A0ABT7CJC2_9BACT|nr:hypothetical protein [Xanthocytophaga flavus]MDJ1467766.1 hypothetical protein [Xanthocytophaga flavus]MDJ1493845.1 hypothetical protein [Xanthocytophaga flavus]